MSLLQVARRLFIKSGFGFNDVQPQFSFDVIFAFSIETQKGDITGGMIRGKIVKINIGIIASGAVTGPKVHGAKGQLFALMLQMKMTSPIGAAPAITEKVQQTSERPASTFIALYIDGLSRVAPACIYVRRKAGKAQKRQSLVVVVGTPVVADDHLLGWQHGAPLGCF